MRKVAILTTTLAMAASVMVVSPAHAAAPSDGKYLCATGEASSSNSNPRFTITDGVVLAGNSCVDSVILPAGVTGIGSWAFNEARLLTGITIPSTVTTIGDYAFFGAVALTSITIPSSVTSIGDYALAGTTSLVSIIVGDGNTNYTSTGGVLFNQLSTTLIRYAVGKSATSYSIPSSVTSIDKGAFSEAKALTSITIPSTVTSIGSYAFERATSLSNITIPSGVTSIGDSTFYSATSLSNITIPSTVTSIGDSAFEGAILLASVYFLGNQPSIGTNAFLNIASGPTAYITSTATGFTKTGTPLRWNGFTVETFNPNGTFLCTTGLPTTSSPNFTITNGAVTLGSNCVGSVVIPAGVTSIGEDAFASANLLTSITIPASVTSIGDSAFKWANLTSITIPASVTSIGSLAFASATSLTSITIPASVTNIGAGAFYGASSLTNIYFLGNTAPTVGFDPFLEIASGAKAYVTSTATGFATIGQTWNRLTVTANVSNGTYLCTSGEPSSSVPNFTITDGVVTLGSNCVGSVVIPASVTSIGENAFWSATSLTSVAIPASVTSIGEYAFQGTTSLTSITIPASVTSIGGRAFWGATSLTSVTVEIANPNYISANGILFNKLATTLISYPAKKSGTSYTIPSNVISIADTAFASASSLTSITIPAGVTSIGSYAFERTTSLTSITMPASVISIGDNAFLNASSLSSINFLSNTAPTVGDYVFSGVAAGATAYITSTATGFTTTGSPPLWNGILVERDVEVDTSNGTYLCTTGLRSSSTPNYTITNGVVTNGSSCSGAVVIPAWVTSIGDSAFDVAKFISSPTTITFGSGSMLTSIGDYAFNGAASLTSITIPTGVTSIGDYAFKGAESLTSITIPTAVRNIGNGALVWTSALTSIMVESGNTNYSSIEGVLFNKSSTTLIRYPAKKTGTTYSIPTGVTNIGNGAFSGATSLTSITIPAGVTSIAFGAFESVISLTSITIPASVKSISDYAFYLSRSLSSVYFLGNAPATIGTNAFSYVSSGAKAYVISTATGFAKAGTTWNGLTVATHAPNGTYLCTTGMPSSSTPSFTVTNGVVSDGSSCAGTIKIPDGVTSIGNKAFENATALTTVTFGSGSVLVSIGNQAFSGAKSLTNITIDVGTESIVSPTSVRFNKVSTTSVRATATTSGINFPTSLTSIGDYAFSGATSITSITFPAAVTSIGNYAFSGATSLRSVYFLGNKPSIGTKAFLNVASGAKAYITSAATGFVTSKTPGLSNGLILEIVAGTKTIGFKKSYVVKTLAKRVGIKIVSSKATVSISVSKTSKKICLVSKSKLSTLKAGKCKVTFTVQEPTPKKGKKPKAKKTTMTLVVK